MNFYSPPLALHPLYSEKCDELGSLAAEIGRKQHLLSVTEEVLWDIEGLRFRYENIVFLLPAKLEEIKGQVPEMKHNELCLRVNRIMSELGSFGLMMSKTKFECRNLAGRIKRNSCHVTSSAFILLFSGNVDVLDAIPIPLESWTAFAFLPDPDSLRDTWHDIEDKISSLDDEIRKIRRHR